MRERIAKAIHDGPSAQTELAATGLDPHPWEECDFQDQYLADADAVLTLLTVEEVWSGGPDAEPVPALYGVDGKVFLDPEHTTPFEPTEEQWRAAGWKRKRRWVTEWEDVDA